MGLLIPDVAVRVALLQFETLPDDHREAETLVLWRMREYLPYAPEEARLSYQVLGKQPGSVEILGVAVRGSVLAEYEAAIGRNQRWAGVGLAGNRGVAAPASRGSRRATPVAPLPRGIDRRGGGVKPRALLEDAVAGRRRGEQRSTKSHARPRASWRLARII